MEEISIGEFARRSRLSLQALRRQGAEASVSRIRDADAGGRGRAVMGLSSSAAREAREVR